MTSPEVLVSHPVLDVNLNPCHYVPGWVPGVGQACGVVDELKTSTHILSGILNEVGKFLTDLPGFIHDIFMWLVNAIFPVELQTWLFGTLGLTPNVGLLSGKGGGLLTISAGNVNDPYHNLFAAATGPGIAIAAVATGARIMKTLLDQRATSMNVVVDAMVRFFVVFALLFPVKGISLGFYIMEWATDAMYTLTNVLAGQFGAASVMKGLPSKGVGMSTTAGPVEQLAFYFTNGFRNVLAMVFGILPFIIFLLYAVLMLIIRTLLLGFCVATAPLCIATAAFDTRNKFFAWWLDIFSGTLMVAPVLAIAFWVSLVLGSSIVTAGIFIGPIICFILFCGAIWMAGKLIHQLTWKHFSHGGAMGAMGAAFGVAATVGKVGLMGGMSSKLANGPLGPGLKKLGEMATRAAGMTPYPTGGNHEANADTLKSGRGDNKNGKISGGSHSLPGGGGNLSQNVADQVDEGIADTLASPQYAGFVGSLIKNNPAAIGASGSQRVQMAWSEMGRSRTGRKQQTELATNVFSAMLGAGILNDDPAQVPEYKEPAKTS